MSSDVLNFWNDRAKLQGKAGSNDLIAKKIEIEALVKYFNDGLDVMEFGCGNGITAIEIAKRFNIHITAYDYSSEMISSARQFVKNSGCADRVSFSVGDITNPPTIKKTFDLVFTERMIINLSSWNEQKLAIQALCGYLKPSGKLLLLENSANGLAKVNQLREMVKLKPIVAPWHNIYLDDEKVEALNIDGCQLLEVIPYSATYYFLSRVVNAWLAELEGKEPDYNSKINKLAIDLPSIGDHAQGKIWVFEKGSV